MMITMMMKTAGKSKLSFAESALMASTSVGIVISFLFLFYWVGGGAGRGVSLLEQMFRAAGN